MAELIPTASEAEWLAARRRGITASEIAVVMGLSPYSSPYALYHQKLGILPADEDQAVFERGRVLEPYIAEKFAAAHPEMLVTGNGRDLYASSDRPWQLATPDRLININRIHPDEWLRGTKGSVLETKTDAGDEWGDESTDEIPVHYRCQVLWQMDVMRVSRAYVACLRMRQWDIREYVIEHGGRDPWEDANHGEGCAACTDQYLMRDAARDFLGRIDRKEAPDVDWRPATIGALKQLHPSLTDEDALVGDRLAANYRAAARNEKHWEQRKKLYEARIREQMGSARRAFTAIGSELVCRRDVYTVREHVRRESTVDKLVIIPPKKES